MTKIKSKCDGIVGSLLSLPRCSSPIFGTQFHEEEAQERLPSIIFTEIRAIQEHPLPEDHFYVAVSFSQLKSIKEIPFSISVLSFVYFSSEQFV